MKILIMGASGFIGSNLAKALNAKDHELVLCARHTDDLINQYPNAEVVQADYLGLKEVAHWLPHLVNVDLVINAVGIIAESRKQTFQAIHAEGPVTLFKACEKSGVKRVIQISALGADEKAFSEYHLTKKQADDYLRQSSLEYVIVQPSVVFGPGGSSTEFFRALAALPIQGLFDGGEQKMQPVFVKDLVEAIVNLANIGSDELPQEMIAVGSEVVTYKEMLACYRNQLGKGKLRSISVPSGIVLFAAKIVGRLVGGMFNEDNIRMLLQGNTGAKEGIEKVLGRPPGSLSEVLGDTLLTREEKIRARNFFLVPGLIAFGVVVIIAALILS